MLKNFTIRDYSIKDKHLLLNLLQLNIPEYFAEEEMAGFDDYLDNKTELYYVILFEDKIVGGGGINFANDETTAKISWDVFHPEFQNKGFGSELLQHRINQLSAMDNIKKVIVRTSQVAYKFYEKKGFNVKEIVNDYWAPGFDLYLMELNKFKQ